MVRKILIPKEVIKGLDILRTLNPDQILVLTKILNESSEMNIETICLQLGDELKISEDTALQLYMNLCYLCDIASERELDENGILSELQDAIQKVEMDKENKDKLIEFFSHPSTEIYSLFSLDAKWRMGRKKRRLTAGLYNPIESFRSICDVRPVFDEKREKIIDAGITITFEIIARSLTGRHEKIFLTLNEEMLENLRKKIEVTYKKIEAIKKKFLQ